MDPTTFKQFSTAMIDYVTNYLENIRERRVVSAVEPGYMRPLLPDNAPMKSDKWEDIMSDIEKVIMPGVTHWQSPNFHAYFIKGQSYPAVVAEILCSSIACVGFSWTACPAITELEVIMLDWLAQMLGLPNEFLRSSGKGCGMILSSASEATLIALLGAKCRKLQQVKNAHPDWKDSDIVDKLVAYSSSESHFSVQKAGLIVGVKFRFIEADSENQMRGQALSQQIQVDKDNGLIPFYVVATLGTTNTCSFDKLDEIGPVAVKENMWLHIDAAYAGAAFVCPQFRYLMKGIENADSFNFNPHKWLLVHFDCSALWFKDPTCVTNAMSVDALIVGSGTPNMPEYRHWEIPLGHTFRALKLWFVLRLYGVENIQKFIEDHVAQAHEFENLVLSDPRFEIIGKVVLGLVCFRLKGSNEINQALLKHINDTGNIYMVPGQVNDTFFLRFAISSRYSESRDIIFAWNEIRGCTEKLVLDLSETVPNF